MSSTRTRMSPDTRREQLLTLGVRLFATRSLDDLSIETLAEEAGISRGLLYHYFGNKQDFHTAVVQRAADDLFAVTAPTGEGTPLEQLAGSLERYVDYVTENYRGYVSLCVARRGATRAPGDLRAVPGGPDRPALRGAGRRGGRRPRPDRHARRTPDGARVGSLHRGRRPRVGARPPRHQSRRAAGDPVRRRCRGSWRRSGRP